MRFAPILLAITLAGCAAEESPNSAVETPTMATDILLIEDVLLSPTSPSMSFEYDVRGAGAGAASAVIEVNLAGSFTGMSIEAPESCETLQSPEVPPGGSLSVVLGCGEISAGVGELVLAISSGTAQGRIAFAVSYVI